MSITYKLYCKECYSRLKEVEPDCSMKARIHKSYFICSSCGFETDRGYAVQVLSTIGPHEDYSKRAPEKKVAFTERY